MCFHNNGVCSHFRPLRGFASFAASVPCFLFIASCASGGGGQAEKAACAAVDVVQQTDSANGVAVFTDADGRIDSLFAARGYAFGADIVKAANSGDADAAFILAQMYAYGVAGARPNRAKAFKLFVNLADNGNAEAKADAGYMLLYGCGVESDPAQGLAMLTDAANEGCATAYLFLGRFYSEAEPTPDNRRNAKLCYAQARDLGIIEAGKLLESLGY